MTTLAKIIVTRHPKRFCANDVIARAPARIPGSDGRVRDCNSVCAGYVGQGHWGGTSMLKGVSAAACAALVSLGGFWATAFADEVSDHAIVIHAARLLDVASGQVLAP